MWPRCGRGVGDQPDYFGSLRSSLARRVIFNQVLRIHSLRRLEGGTADQEVGSPCQTTICADHR
jgi:hypothetical protein